MIIIDILHRGGHVGLRARRIEQYRLDLCISGHIHEAKGRDILPATPIVNPGMLRGGGWVTVSINLSQLEVHLQ